MSKAHPHTHTEPEAKIKEAATDTCASLAAKLEELIRDIHIGISEPNRDRVCGELESLAKRIKAIG